MSRNKRLSSLEELIFDLVKNHPKQTFNKDELEDVLELSSKKEYRRFDKALNSLASKGLLFKSGKSISTKGEKKTTKRNMKNFRGTLEGRIQITPRGTGYVIVEDLDDDVQVSRKETSTALPDDIVRVLIQGTNKRTNQPKGKVVDILERGKDFYVGTLKRTGAKTYIIEPDVKSAHIDFFVQPENINGAQNDDKVVFELKKWVHQKALPEAVITSVLGKTGTNDANILSILAEN